MWHYRQEKRITWHIREKYSNQTKRESRKNTEQKHKQQPHTINVCTQRFYSISFHYSALVLSSRYSTDTIFIVFYFSYFLCSIGTATIVVVVANFFPILRHRFSFFIVLLSSSTQLFSNVFFSCIFSCVSMCIICICKAIVIAVLHGTYRKVWLRYIHLIYRTYETGEREREKNLVR